MVSIKKKIELILTLLLAFFSTSLAKRFVFRKALNLTFSQFKSHHVGEVEILLLPYLLKKDFAFIDIGANKGLYCYYSEKIISAAQIIAFEPIPKLAHLIRKLFPKISTVEKALSNENGKAILNIPIHNQNYLIDTRGTLEKDSPELLGKFETISVDVITLDDYLKSSSITKIGLIKIDVEGHELKLLEGAKKTILENRQIIIIEIEPINHPNGLDKAFEFVHQFNYTIYYFCLNTLSLKHAYNSIEKASIPTNSSFAIHNYVCFPNEKTDEVNKINLELKKQV